MTEPSARPTLAGTTVTEMELVSILADLVGELARDMGRHDIASLAAGVSERVENHGP